jgi:N-acetyl-gamma-glutamyl-phosphate reductase
VITASIVGATGYTGALLTDILDRHSGVELGALTSKSYVGRRVSDVFPRLRVEGTYVNYDLGELRGSDVVFVCYPHAEAYPAVAELVDAGCRVVDLSADFRLKDPTAYSSWYGFDHPRPDLVREAVYGLTEAYRAFIQTARLVANPGCYPTGMLLGLLPVAGDIDDRGAIVDAKSGVSGAGRTPSEKTHFCSVTEDFKSYSEVGHRHTAEMLQELALAGKRELPVSFTPHLLPVDRGILSTIYVRLRDGVAGKAQELVEKYRTFYAAESFVEICERAPALAEVSHTNYCRIALWTDEKAGLVKIVTVIDNLMKGASGQAVQNMNVMFGFQENEGLGRAA